MLPLGVGGQPIADPTHLMTMDMFRARKRQSFYKPGPPRKGRELRVVAPAHSIRIWTGGKIVTVEPAPADIVSSRGRCVRCWPIAWLIAAGNF